MSSVCKGLAQANQSFRDYTAALESLPEHLREGLSLDSERLSAFEASMKANLGKVTQALSLKGETKV